MNENVSRNRSRGEVLTKSNYPPEQVQHYFKQAAGHLETLKTLLPDLYSDFQPIKTEPETIIVDPGSVNSEPVYFSRGQADRLLRDIEQIFEIRANSELEQPKQEPALRVFITHGRFQ